MNDTDIAAWFDRYDSMKPDADQLEINEDAPTDDDMRRAGDAISPMYARAAARAGVDYDDLEAVIVDRMTRLPRVVINRCVVNGRMDIERLAMEILSVAATMSMDAFCAGVLFEQERHLPNLDGPS